MLNLVYRNYEQLVLKQANLTVTINLDCPLYYVHNREKKTRKFNHILYTFGEVILVSSGTIKINSYY